MQRKIIAIDIDGTLTDDKKRIMPETKAELIKLSDMGHKIVLCSGRAITGIEPYLKELNLWGKKGQYAIAFNGGGTYDLSTENVIDAGYLNNQEVMQIAKLSHSLNVNGEIITSSSNSYIINGKESVYKKIDRKNSQLIFHKVNDYSFLKSEHVQKYLWVDEPQVITKQIENIPADFFKDFQIVRSAPVFLEFLPKNVSKGNAILHLSQALDIQSADIIVLGDEENDLSMFNIAGVAIAMENARDEIKKSATMISIADNNHDGVGKTLKLLFDSKRA